MKKRFVKKISVIIPVYNSERYIEQCLCSVTGQTYGNLEIIVVDDGSVDDSAAICGRLAETDGRIRVLRQKNSGVSAARNHGIDAATGEYVFFLDSDDAVHPLLLEEMLRQAEEYHAQLAFCGYRKLDSSRLEAVLEEVSGLPGTEAAGAAWGEELPGRAREMCQGEKLPEGTRETAQGEELSGSARETCQGEELPGSTRETYQGEKLPEGTRKTAQGAVPEKYADGRWLTADETGTEEWFHVKHTDTFSGIGGKLILREAVGQLRFDSGLVNGEDTFFLYQLVRNRVRSVYCQEEWYYYRMHGESVTGSAGTARSMQYFESAVRIRDGEYGSGNAEHAMRWEILVVDQVRRSYEAQKGKETGSAEITGSAEGTGSTEKTGKGKAAGADNAGRTGVNGKADRANEGGEAEKARRKLRKIAAAEMRHPLFRSVCLSDRLLFACCFGCYPVYVILNRIVLGLAKRRSR